MDVPFAVALRRALQRDATLFGSPEAVRARYQQRYIPGQRLYLERAQPQLRTDVIVANEPPDDPQVTFRDAS